MAYRYIIRPLRRQFILFRSFQLAKSLHGKLQTPVYDFNGKSIYLRIKHCIRIICQQEAKLNGKRLFLTNNKTRNFRVAKAILFVVLRTLTPFLFTLFFIMIPPYIKPFAKSSLSLSVSACTTGLGWASVSISIERFSMRA